MRIFLIGYMASGKSTVGVLLAKKLGVQFIDSDKEIESIEGLPIATIFSERGEPHFRELEHSVLSRLIESHDTFVMSTGGGMACFYNHIEVMKSSGVVIYLECEPGTIHNRLQLDKPDRPLRPKSLSELTAHLNERETFYNQAHFIINSDRSASLIVNEICNFLADMKAKH